MTEAVESMIVSEKDVGWVWVRLDPDLLNRAPSPLDTSTNTFSHSC